MLYSFKLEAASYSSVSFCVGKGFLIVASSYMLFIERYRQQEANSWSVLI